MDIFKIYEKKHNDVSDQNKLSIFFDANQIVYKSIKCIVSPSVLSYEIEPLEETRIGNIMKLKNDIALLLKTDYINIIPSYRNLGKIVIEVKNNYPYLLGIKSLIDDLPDLPGALPVLLGCNTQNKNLYRDLSEMPHLLIAGATGQGKSVCMHSIIASLLYHKNPSNVKFVFIDPKLVEFSVYRSLINYHFFDWKNQIFTEPDEIVDALNNLIDEMNKRYKILENAGRRNIKELDNEMPYIVIFIDEFADIIQSLGIQFQQLITNLAQKSRAVGIHLILATQRPSVKVVSGEIKTNFPARIAFKCVSRGDSQTVLGYSGAEKLFGNGDALLLYNADIIHFQCPLITIEETTNLIESVNNKYSNQYKSESIIASENSTTCDSSVNFRTLEDVSLQEMNNPPKFYKNMIDEMGLLKIINAQDYLSTFQNVLFKYLPLWKVILINENQGLKTIVHFYDSPFSIQTLNERNIKFQPCNDLNLQDIENIDFSKIQLSCDQQLAYYDQYNHFSKNFYKELNAWIKNKNEWNFKSIEKILYPYWHYISLNNQQNEGEILIDAVFGYQIDFPFSINYKLTNNNFSTLKS